MTYSKIIATDMDGTFLNANGTYDTILFEKVLQACEERGWLFTVASGRGLLALDKLFADYKDRIAVVAENGSLVRFQNQILFESALNEEQCQRIIQALADNPYGDDHRFLMSGHKACYALTTAPKDYLEHEKDYHENIQLVESFDDVDDQILKFTAHLYPEDLDKGTAWLNQSMSDVTFVSTSHQAIDIILNGINKGLGLQELCRKVGLIGDDVIAFGDNLNDMEMLTFAGKGLAMANARPELKALADDVIGHHADGAVLIYLEQLLRK